MSKGSLLEYLRKGDGRKSDFKTLVDIAAQVCDTDGWWLVIRYRHTQQYCSERAPSIMFNAAFGALEVK